MGGGGTARSFEGRQTRGVAVNSPMWYCKQPSRRSHDVDHPTQLSGPNADRTERALTTDHKSAARVGVRKHSQFGGTSRSSPLKSQAWPRLSHRGMGLVGLGSLIASSVMPRSAIFKRGIGMLASANVLARHVVLHSSFRFPSSRCQAQHVG